VLVVGLTGGIGSGKSAVSGMLTTRGAVVLDADVHAREVVAPGTPGLAAVVAEFGDGVLAPDGSLDREALGKLVFPDPAALARLNAIVHPLVGALSDQRRREAEAAGIEVVVHDVPLLAENDLAALYDLVVVVDCSEQTQLRRLVEQRGMDGADARARMARQATREQRLAIADEVITNEGTLADLETQVDALWSRLLARAQAATAEPAET
jgi:dephospho-CoA kinase